MCRLMILISIVLLYAVTGYSESFENLSVMDVTGFGTITIRYDKAITEIINEQIKDDRGIRAMVTRLVRNSPIQYLIVFDPGPSDDPEFIIYEVSKKGEKELVSLRGQELIIPGNGVIYTSGFVDLMFNTRKKFILHNSSIKEVQQPFYYVGLKTIVNKPIVLYGDLSYKKILAQLPEGSKVEVLINKENDFLIKTPFGLVGWLKDESRGCGSEVIEDLCFHGD